MSRQEHGRALRLWSLQPFMTRSRLTATAHVTATAAPSLTSPCLEAPDFGPRSSDGLWKEGKGREGMRTGWW